MSYSTTIPPQQSHFISVQQAAAMIGRYRLNREAILAEDYKGQDILPLSETFNRDVFDVLLAREDAAGIRVYNGMDATFKLHTIIVAVNESNQDILPPSSLGSQEGDDDYVGEEGQRCPNICPEPSVITT